ncbi:MULTISPECIES: tryptophan halogenase family protein [Alkalimonas]|uniref:Tryptophan 7-halogenase n=1 Tax=Alkalimonas mucilaginosa TaxID=3057676 RepID=A0ABU7JFW3_9GAMM|nr:tryptophan halogenase family protein [Alkalimonas sp. MEB004]MEE2024336.1 tryptophan 7-halogenase [Alkalimonas sp. MEB004]
MNTDPIRKVVIVGGGTAGWISAALLVKMLGKSVQICLVESEDIGIVGVGEATIPPIIHFNEGLGLDERAFLRETMGTIKLGIQFENWGQQGDSYMHAFGSFGKDFPFCSFHHFWLKAKAEGLSENFWDFSLNFQAAKANKFSKLERIAQANLPGLVYAYHFDAALYAKFLRRSSEAMGVCRIEGKIEQVHVCEQSGFVQSVQLANGQQIAGDLFIDCSGMHSLLIEKTLNTGYEDWSHWLPCDRALAVPTEAVKPIVPYTRSIAHKAGWQWRIPLQHRTGNGLVYASNYLSDDEAQARLLQKLDAPTLAEPRLIRFRTGRRLKQWHKNVVSIGLSSGFLEPLESTSIHLIQSGVIRLVNSFPHQGIKQVEVDEYNRQSQIEFEHIRDFIILHYKLTKRTDSKFWRDCRRMDIPERLARKMALFEASGKVYREQDELFTPIAWVQVMLGQGMLPADFHPMANALSPAQLQELMDSLSTIYQGSLQPLPLHDVFIQQFIR